MKANRLDLDAAYQDDTDYQEELDKIDSYLGHWRGKVEHHEQNQQAWQDRLEANQEKLKLAEKVLSGPTQFGISSRARVDRAEAQEMIQRCREEIADYQGPIDRARGAVAEYEAKKKAFPMDKLRAQRKLQDLQERCRKPKNL